MALDQKDIEALASAMRKGTHAETFEDQVSEIVDPYDPENRAAFARTPAGIAEKNLAAMIKEQDERHDAFESGVALDSEGLPLEPVGVDELAEQIDALRSKRDANPAQFEMLDFQLDQRVGRRATMNLTVLMEEQDERRQDEVAERQAEIEAERF